MTIGTPKNIENYYYMNWNKTEYAITWCMTEWQINDNFSIPCKFE